MVWLMFIIFDKVAVLFMLVNIKILFMIVDVKGEREGERENRKNDVLLRSDHNSNNNK